LVASAAGVIAATMSASKLTRRSASLALANTAAEQLKDDPAGALRSGLEAFAIEDNLASRRVLAEVLGRYPHLAHVLRGRGETFVRGVAISADGSVLAAGDEQGGLRFWNLERMREFSASAPDAPRTSGALAFTTDGAWLVSGGWGTVSVWSATAFTPVSVLDVGDAVGAIAVRRDGLVAVNGRAGLVRLLRIDGRGGLQRADSIVLATEEYAHSLAFSPADGSLAIGSGRQIYLVDSGRPSTLRTVAVDSASIRFESLAYSGDGRMLAAADGSENVTVWRVRDWTAVEAPPDAPERRPVGGMLAFQPDGTLLTGSEFGAIRSWPADSTDEGDPAFSVVDTIGTWPSEISAMASSANGRALAAGSRDGTVSVWRLDGSRWLRRNLPSRAGALGPAMDASGRYFVSQSYSGGTLGVWDAESGDSTMLGVRASAGTLDGTATLAASLSGDTLLLWDLRAAGAFPRKPVLTGIAAPTGVRISPGRKVLVWNDSSVFVWDAVAGKTFRRAGRGGRVLATSPEFDRIALAVGQETALHLMDVSRAPPRPLVVADSAFPALAAVFTNRGRELLSYHVNGVIVRWRLERDGPQGEVVDTVIRASPRVRQYTLSQATFSSDARFLAVNFGGQPPVVWDLARRGAFFPASGSPRGTGMIALNEDGSTLVVYQGSDSYAVDLRPHTWTRAACSILFITPDSALRTQERIGQVCRTTGSRPQRTVPRS
ncbi:MAG TPA: WD40 repeat domain-containing protein, partial [Longimicrobium sp.]|nr:WD40 repeat domain-containing protein [Longimicrobium sp.]